VSAAAAHAGEGAPMSPGTYLRKRREAAGLSVGDVARRLIALPVAVRRVSPDEIGRLTARLGWIEGDRDYLTESQAALLTEVLPMDGEVYLQLTLLHAIGPDRIAWSGLPVPQVCRECACSWHDPCQPRTSGDRPCSWSADPTLCTHCELAAVAVPVPQPSSIPARAQPAGIPA
jgi:hypothetical protein